MKYNPNIHHRRSIRLKGYNYSTPDNYFITICAHNRKCIFGEIIDGKMELNNIGRMIEKIWLEIPMFYENIELDEFIVMPNHFHGIITIVGADPRVRPIKLMQTQGFVNGQTRGFVNGQTQGFAPTGRQLSLSQIIQYFKSLTTKKYIDGVKNNNWEPFDHRLWQRNYYERIIRNEKSLNQIRDYVISNPDMWNSDRNNPDCINFSK